MLSLSWWVNLFYFLYFIFGLFWFCLCVYIPSLLLVFAWFCVYHLSGLSFVPCFSAFLLTPFISITNCLWNLSSLARDWALSLWSGSANNKTLDCQKTPNWRSINWWKLPQRSTRVFKIQYHLVQDTLPKGKQETKKTQTISSANWITTTYSSA